MLRKITKKNLFTAFLLRQGQCGSQLRENYSSKTILSKNTAVWAQFKSLATDQRFTRSAKTSAKRKSARCGWLSRERSFSRVAFQSVSEDSRLCVVGGRVEDNSGGYLMASLPLPLDSHPFTCASKNARVGNKSNFLFSIRMEDRNVVFQQVCFNLLFCFLFNKRGIKVEFDFIEIYFQWKFLEQK